MRPVWGPATYTKGGPYEQKLFELANAQIDVQIVPVVDYDTKANTILASGKIPDVMWGSGPVNPIWRGAQDQGAFLPVNKYLDKYPALKKAVPSHTWDIMKDKKGQIYFLPNTLWPIVPFFAFYRQDLFEQANISRTPTSTDEFVSMLGQIHQAFPDKYPLSLSLDAYLWQAKDMATSFGLSLGSWMPNPKNPKELTYYIELEKTVEFFFWMQEIHKKGLLDPNSGVHDDPNFMQDEFKAGKSVILLENWAVYPSLAPDLKKVVPTAKVSALPPLGQQAGTRAVFPVDRGFYVSASYGGADAFFDFLNWTFTGGNNFRRWGIEGATYKVVNGQNQTIPNSQRASGYIGAQIEPLSFLSPFSEKMDWNSVQQNFEAAGVGEDFAWVKAMFNRYGQQQFPDWANPTVITPTQSKKGTQIWENTMVDTIDGVVINNQMTQQSWSTAVKRWEAAGGTQMIRERNQEQKNKTKPNYLA